MASGRDKLVGRSRTIGAICAFVVFGMVAMSYAAVPLYRMFCHATGFGGTPQRADRAPGQVLERKVTVRFDANVGAGLPWDFVPVVTTTEVRIGEPTLAFFRATNRSKQPVKGMATFNITPDQVGAYFDKVQCFCFTEQLLQPGQSIDMPVSFFIDPAFASDPNTSGFDTITLSYTFYPVDER